MTLCSKLKNLFVWGKHRGSDQQLSRDLDDGRLAYIGVLRDRINSLEFKVTSLANKVEQEEGLRRGAELALDGTRRQLKDALGQLDDTETRYEIERKIVHQVNTDLEHANEKIGEMGSAIESKDAEINALRQNVFDLCGEWPNTRCVDG